MRFNIKSIIKISSTIAIVVAVVGYGLYQARNLIQGPQINISEPYTGQSFTDPLITITGTAANISYISLNDRQIFIDQTGRFYDKLLLPPGYTIMKLAARDKFGRTVTKLLELTYATSSTEITKTN